MKKYCTVEYPNYLFAKCDPVDCDDIGVKHNCKYWKEVELVDNFQPKVEDDICATCKYEYNLEYCANCIHREIEES
jgi:hypothetical protein